MLNAQLATALLAQEKNDEALPVLETLRQLEPNNGAVDHMLADAYSQSGHPDKADPIYAKLVSSNPGDEEILAAQGENLVRERLYPQAQSVFERAVKLKPDDGDAWSGLGFRGIGEQAVSSCIERSFHAIKISFRDSSYVLPLGNLIR